VSRSSAIAYTSFERDEDEQIDMVLSVSQRVGDGPAQGVLYE